MEDNSLFYKVVIGKFEDDKYPLLHKNKYVLCQNVQINNEYIKLSKEELIAKFSL